MNLNQFEKEKYSLQDGEIVSLFFEPEKFGNEIFSPSTITILIYSKQLLAGLKYRSCKLSISLKNILRFDFIADMTFNGGYSDCTILELEDKTFYISFDPFSNSNMPDEKDNFVIIAKNLDIIEVK